MRKIKRYIIVVITALFTFNLMACAPSFAADFIVGVEGVEGISNIVVNTDEKKISFTVAPDINEFDTKGIKTIYENIIITPLNTNTNSTVVKLVNGENIFNIKISGSIVSLGITYDLEEEWTLIINKLSTLMLLSIKVDSWKDEYIVGEKFEDGKLMLNFSDNISYKVDLKQSMVSGFDTSTPGEITVDITYSDLTIQHTINVISLSDTITNVDIRVWYSEYRVNSSFKDGLLNVYFDNKTTTAKLTQDMVSGFSTLHEGTFEATITYEGYSFVKEYTVVAYDEESGKINNREQLAELLTKFELFFNNFVVPGDEEYDSLYVNAYNKYLYGTEINHVIDLFETGEIGDKHVEDAIAILDDNVVYYKQITLEINEMESFYDIVAKIFEEYERHQDILNSMVDFLSNSQIVAMLLTIDFENDRFFNMTFEEYKEIVAPYANSTEIIEQMEKYFKLNNGFDFDENNWFELIATTKNVLKVIINFDQSKIEFIVNTIGDIIFDELSSADVAISISYIGELILEINDVIPSYNIFEKFLSFNMSEKINIFVTSKLINVLGNVLVDFNADKMIDIMDLLEHDYMITAILHYLSSDLINHIDETYDNFAVEFAQSFVIFDYLSSDECYQIALDVYNLLVSMSNNSNPTDNEYENYNNKINEIIEKLSDINDGRIEISRDNFIVNKGISKEEFINYLNQHSQLIYDGFRIEFAESMCTNIDLNKAGIQYMAITINNDVINVPVFVFDNNMDELEIINTYSYISFDNYDFNETIFISHDTFNVHGLRLSYDITFKHKIDNVKFYLSQGANEFTINDLYGVDKTDTNTQNVLLKYEFLKGEYLYYPLEIKIIDFEKPVNIFITNTKYLYQNQQDSLYLEYSKRYIWGSEGGSIGNYFSDEVDFSVVGKQYINYTFEGIVYQVEVEILPTDYLVYNTLNTHTNGISINSDILDINLSIEDNLPNSHNLEYSRYISLKNYIAYCESLGIEITYNYVQENNYGRLILDYVFNDKTTKQKNVTFDLYDYQILTIKFDSIYRTKYHSSNMLTIQDCEDINSNQNLHLYEVSYVNNFGKHRNISLSNLIANGGSVYIDINNEQLVITYKNIQYTIDIRIVYNIYVSDVRFMGEYGFYDPYFSYYYQGIGCVYVELVYRDAETQSTIGSDYYRFPISSDDIDTEAQGLQNVQLNIFGLKVKCSVYVMKDIVEEITGINNINYYKGITNLDDMKITINVRHNETNSYSNKIIDSSQYTIKDKESIDLNNSGMITIIYQNLEYSTWLNVNTKEEFFDNLIDTYNINSYICNTNANDNYINIKPYINNEFSYYSQKVKISELISYVESFNSTIIISKINTDITSYQNITINIDGRNKIVGYIPFSLEMTGMTLLHELTSNNGDLTLDDINNISNYTNLENYMIKLYSISDKDNYTNTISLLELWLKYNVIFTKVGNNLVINIYNMEHTFSI